MSQAAADLMAVRADTPYPEQQRMMQQLALNLISPGVADQRLGG